MNTNKNMKGALRTKSAATFRYKSTGEGAGADTVTLAQVATAIETKAAATQTALEAKASNEDLAKATEDAAKQLKAVKDQVDALEAKGKRPGSGSKKSEITVKDIVAEFARKGLPGLTELQTKAGDLQISVDAQGGFALPAEVASNIIKLQHEASPIRQLVGGITTSTTDYSQVVSVGGAASGWVGETDARAKTDSPELLKINATFGEVYAAPKAFQHVLEDAFFNVEAWLSSEVAREFTEKENDAFLRGNGINKPVGILNGLDTTSAFLNPDASRAFGNFQVIKTGQASTLGATSDGVINKLREMVLAMKTGHLPGARWMMSRGTHAVLVNLKDSDGNYFLQRDITKAAADQLFGYSIVINEDMDEIGAGNFPVIFGDFKSAFQVIDRVGTSMLRDPYSAYGAVSFYTRKRVGSMVLNTESLKVLAVEA